MRYVALLRGIGPMNPNMRNEKLRSVVERLGFGNVASVVSSGNVVFDGDDHADDLEDRLEAAWPDHLGFTSTTIVRSADEISSLLAAEPFGDRQHSKETSLEVTFLQHPGQVGLDLPFTSDDGSYTILSNDGRSVCSVTDTTRPTPPDWMRRIERDLGKRITTRTWLTVQRIGKKLDAG